MVLDELVKYCGLFAFITMFSGCMSSSQVSNTSADLQEKIDRPEYVLDSFANRAGDFVYVLSPFGKELPAEVETSVDIADIYVYSSLSELSDNIINKLPHTSIIRINMDGCRFSVSGYNIKRPVFESDYRLIADNLKNVRPEITIKYNIPAYFLNGYKDMDNNNFYLFGTVSYNYRQPIYTSVPWMAGDELLDHGGYLVKNMSELADVVNKSLSGKCVIYVNAGDFLPKTIDSCVERAISNDEYLLLQSKLNQSQPELVVKYSRPNYVLNCFIDSDNHLLIYLLLMRNMLCDDMQTMLPFQQSLGSYKLEKGYTPYEDSNMYCFNSFDEMINHINTEIPADAILNVNVEGKLEGTTYRGLSYDEFLIIKNAIETVQPRISLIYYKRSIDSESEPENEKAGLN